MDSAAAIRPEAELETVARRVAEGDVDAFREIVDATSARLVRLSARLVGSVADAEDVVQDAYVRAYRSLVSKRFDGRARLETWLYRIVVNASIDALRSRKRREAAAPEEVEVLDGEASADAHVALKELDDWLRDLPESQRVALTLTAIEGMTAGEVARILECSEGAVEQRLVRARATLRRKKEPA